MTRDQVEEELRQILVQQINCQHLLDGHTTLYTGACFMDNKEDMTFQHDQLVTLFQCKLDLTYSMHRLLKVKVMQGWM